jgi:hypothetical protein
VDGDGLVNVKEDRFLSSFKNKKLFR